MRLSDTNSKFILRSNVSDFDGTVEYPSTLASVVSGGSNLALSGGIFDSASGSSGTTGSRSGAVDYSGSRAISYFQTYNVSSVDWSNDGNYLAVGGNSNYATDNKSHRIYQCSGGELSEVGSGYDHGESVYSVAWRPGSHGDYLAVCGSPSDSVTHRIYSVGDGVLSQVTQSGGHDNFGTHARCVAWSPDGNFLAICGNLSGSVTHKIYSVTAGGVLTVVSQSGGNDNHGQLCYAIGWSRNGDYVAVGGNRTNEITHRVYSVNSGVLTQVGSGYDHGTTVYTLAWRPNKDHLAIGGYQGGGYSHRVYSSSAGVLSLVGSYDYGSAVNSCVWSSGGGSLAVGGYCITSTPVTHRIYYAASNGELALSGSLDNLYGYVNSLAWHSTSGLALGSNSSVLTDTDYRSVWVFDNSAGTISSTSEFEVASSFSASIDINAAGTYAVMGGSNVAGKTHRTYSISGGTLTEVDSENNGYQINSVKFNPAGTRIAVGAYTNHLDITHRIYSVSAGEITEVGSGYTLSAASGAANGVTWENNGNYIAVVGSRDATNEVTHKTYSVDGSGNLTLAGTYDHGGTLYATAWSPNGIYLAVGGAGGDGGKHLRIYSHASGVLTEKGAGYALAGTVRSVAWSSDSTHLAVGGDRSMYGGSVKTHRIYACNSETGILAEVGSGYEHGDHVYSVAWGNNDDYLFVGGNSDALDAQEYNGRCYSVDGAWALSLVSSVKTGNGIMGCAWYPDGSRLILSGYRMHATTRRSTSLYSVTEEVRAALALSGNGRIQSNHETIPDPVTISGTDNTIVGTPTFASTVSLDDSSTEVTLSLANKLSTNIALGGGTVILGTSLALADGVSFTGDGKIDVNGKTLEMAGQEATWSGTLTLENAGDIELHAKTNLTGTWFFGPTQTGSGTSGATLNGNGNILELGTNGVIRLDQEVGLALTDVVVKGLGDYGSKGRFILHDVNSTLSLSNTTIVLDGSVSLTQGKMLVHGTDCSIITGSHKLEFSDTMCCTVDGVTLWYDPMSTGDQRNIRRGSDVAYGDDGVNIDYQNNGVIRCVVPGAGDSITIASSTSLTKNEVISSSRTITFSGAATLTGDGYAIEWARGSSGANAMVLGANAVTLTGIVLRNFHTAGVSGIANLSLGDDVSIELAADESITSKWNFTGTTTASTIYGKGCKLTLSVEDALNISNGVTLNLQDVKVAGITPTNDIEIACSNEGTHSASKLVLKDTQLEFAGEYPFAEASIDISGDCVFGGRTADASFGLRTSGTMTILADSTLTIDRNFTFTYEGRPILGGSNPNGMERLKFANSTTSRLYLDGCEFRTSTTGAKLTGGRLIIDDKVTFSSGAHHDASAIVIDSSLTVEVLKGSTLDMYGYVAYES
ncbi:WD40 repeat domain-containing protein [bacterium]|nr:WD40 repeat domain-containing protein [bacterium]